jgi:hypothetical protein
MEDKFQIVSAGQEFGKDDVNLVSTEAALADDRILAELLRLKPLGAPTRGILPPSHNGSPITAAAICAPSGAADARVVIYPFRAVIGPVAPATGLDMHRNSRSAISVGTADMWQYATFAAATNNRWDLLYAVVAVDIDGPGVTRYTKTSASPATASTVVTTKKTTVTLAVVQGVEAGTPARPAIPADSGSNYYIPLAYVLLPAGHTLVTSIAATNIFEVAPVLSVSRAMGVNTMAPATGMSSSSGIAVVTETWTPASGRPKAFLPATMAGADTVIIALNEMTAPRTIALGTTGIIDSSRDWRRRLFRVTAVAGTSGFCWNTGAPNFPNYSSTSTVLATANSHNVTSYAGTDSMIFNFTSAFGSGSDVAAGASVAIYVDHATGALKCTVSATDPACSILVWLEATAQFNNAA